MILRQGKHVFRTLYLQSPDDPDGDGKLIGIVDTPELAAEIVEAVNFYGSKPGPPTPEELEHSRKVSANWKAREARAERLRDGLHELAAECFRVETPHELGKLVHAILAADDLVRGDKP